MKIKEAVEIYNKYFGEDIINKYEEARATILTWRMGMKRKDVYYKSSKLYDYYIYKPYDVYNFTNNGVEKIHYSFDYHSISNEINKQGGYQYCLALCDYTEDEIKERIEEKILKDNEKYQEEEKI